MQGMYKKIVWQLKVRYEQNEEEVLVSRIKKYMTHLKVNISNYSLWVIIATFSMKFK